MAILRKPFPALALVTALSLPLASACSEDGSTETTPGDGDVAGSSEMTGGDGDGTGGTVLTAPSGGTNAGGAPGTSAPGTITEGGNGEPGDSCMAFMYHAGGAGGATATPDDGEVRGEVTWYWDADQIECTEFNGWDTANVEQACFENKQNGSIVDSCPIVDELIGACRYEWGDQYLYANTAQQEQAGLADAMAEGCEANEGQWLLPPR